MKRAAVLLAFALLATACGGGPATTPRPKIQATTAPGAVTLKVTGAVGIDYSGNPKVQRVSSTGAGVPEGLRFLSVAVPEPQASGALKFRVGFNLYGYDEKATATIPAVQGSPSPGLRSIAYLDIVAPAARRFDHATQACALTLRNDAYAGELSCPALTDATGVTVSLRMTWDLSS